MENKHFVIGLNADSHVFEFECSTIHEAYDAILDAAIAFGFTIDEDEIIEHLVEMKQDNSISYYESKWFMRVADDEV